MWLTEHRTSLSMDCRNLMIPDQVQCTNDIFWPAETTLSCPGPESNSACPTERAPPLATVLRTKFLAAFHTNLLRTLDARDTMIPQVALALPLHLENTVPKEKRTGDYKVVEGN